MAGTGQEARHFVFPSQPAFDCMRLTDVRYSGKTGSSKHRKTSGAGEFLCPVRGVNYTFSSKSGCRTCPPKVNSELAPAGRRLPDRPDYPVHPVHPDLKAVIMRFWVRNFAALPDFYAPYLPEIPNPKSLIRLFGTCLHLHDRPGPRHTEMEKGIMPFCSSRIKSPDGRLAARNFQGN